MNACPFCDHIHRSDRDGRFTALGRMEENRHYLSDVVFGASIGLAAGYAAVARKEVPVGLGFLSIGPDQAGIRVRF